MAWGQEKEKIKSKMVFVDPFGEDVIPNKLKKRRLCKVSIKSKFCFLQLKEDEENLRAEVVKAMNHLSTFCKEKKF